MKIFIRYIAIISSSRDTYSNFQDGWLEAVRELVLSAIIDARLSLMKYRRVMFPSSRAFAAQCRWCQALFTAGFMDQCTTWQRIKSVNYKCVLVSQTNAHQEKAVRKLNAGLMTRDWNRVILSRKYSRCSDIQTWLLQMYFKDCSTSCSGWHR